MIQDTLRNCVEVSLIKNKRKEYYNILWPPQFPELSISNSTIVERIAPSRCMQSVAYAFEVPTSVIASKSLKFANDDGILTLLIE